MTIAEFDHLNLPEKRILLTKCCGSARWVEKMLAAPWAEDLVDLEEMAEESWYQCSEKDWLQAFEHHPKIGDKNSIKEKFANTSDWASEEQSGVDDTGKSVLNNLAVANVAYEQKFGYIFIVCATGKPAGEMLDILQKRLLNTAGNEIQIAAEEQLKITKLRLEKLFL